MLNNNSSNKFNMQSNENNDLYVEDIYKDLYPTDNDNQNINEVNNINSQPEMLDPKQLKKQQKALKKAQKEEEKRRKIAEKERKKREKLALKMQKNNKYTSELVENIYAMSDKRQEKQYDENDEYIQPINLFDYYEDENTENEESQHTEQPEEIKEQNLEEPEINDELILDYPITPIEDENKKPKTGFKKMPPKSEKKELDEEDNLNTYIEENISDLNDEEQETVETQKLENIMPTAEELDKEFPLEIASDEEENKEISEETLIEDTVYPISEDIPTEDEVENQISEFESLLAATAEEEKEEKVFEAETTFTNNDIVEESTPIIESEPEESLENLEENFEEPVDENDVIEAIIDESDEEPVVEEAIPQEPEIEDELAEEPAAEETISEEPEIEDELDEEPVVEEEISEEPEIEDEFDEEPVIEEVIPEETEIEDEIDEEPVTEEVIVEEPEIEDEFDEEPVVEEEISAETEIEDEIDEEPVVEEVIVEESEIEDEIDEEPAVEETISEEPEIEDELDEESEAEKEIFEEPEVEDELEEEPVVEEEVFEEPEIEDEIDEEQVVEEVIPEESEIEEDIDEEDDFDSFEIFTKPLDIKKTIDEDSILKTKDNIEENVINSDIYNKMQNYLMTSNENKENESKELEQQVEKIMISEKDNPIQEQMKKNREETEKSFDEISKQINEFDDFISKKEEDDIKFIYEDNKESFKEKQKFNEPIITKIEEELTAEPEIEEEVVEEPELEEELTEEPQVEEELTEEPQIVEKVTENSEIEEVSEDSIISNEFNAEPIDNIEVAPEPILETVIEEAFQENSAPKTSITTDQNSEIFNETDSIENNTNEELKDKKEIVTEKYVEEPKIEESKIQQHIIEEKTIESNNSINEISKAVQTNYNVETNNKIDLEKNYKPPFTTNPVMINNIRSMEKTISEISKEKKQPEEFIIPKESETLQLEEIDRVNDDEIKGIVKESKSEDGITFKPLKYQITEISYNDKLINSIEDDRLPLSQILYVISLRSDNSKREMLIEKPKQIITRANIDQLRFKMKEIELLAEKIKIAEEKEELRRKEEMLQRMMINNQQQNYNKVITNYQNDIQNQEIDDISDFFDMINQRNQNQVNIQQTQTNMQNQYRIEQNSQEFKFCMRCGTMNNINAKHCMNCGEKM